MKLLHKKTAVITGCNRGIGKAILKSFAENGADIFACVRKKNDDFSHFIAESMNVTGVQITPIYFDLNNAEEMKEAITQIRSTKKPIDILVNNAGIIFTALFQMTSLDKMQEIFDINFFSQMQFTQYISKLMIPRKIGSIINFSSSAAIEGNEGRAAYAASKAAMITATKVIAKELAVHHVRVNAIAPGLTQTDMMIESTSPEAIENTLKRICLKRVGQPEEIANVVLFLASHLSSYMTGQVLRVDGGM